MCPIPQRAHNVTTNDAKFKNQLAGLGRMSNKVLLPILHDDHYFMIAANCSDGIMTYYNSFGLIDKTSLEYVKVVVTLYFYKLNESPVYGILVLLFPLLFSHVYLS